jgi:hypothetical protein
MGRETGCSRCTPRPPLCGCQRPRFETSSSGPRNRTRISRFKAARRAVGPVRIASTPLPSSRRMAARRGPSFEPPRVYWAARVAPRLLAVWRPKSERATEVSPGGSMTPVLMISVSDDGALPPRLPPATGDQTVPGAKGRDGAATERLHARPWPGRLAERVCVHLRHGEFLGG